MAMWDGLWVNARLATMVPGGDAYGAIDEGAIAVMGGRIVWVGPKREVPGPPGALARHVHDARGGWITPGLIDPHTHLVYGGDRAQEFEMRLEGATYEQIARAGGGILATVRATRAADDDTLFASASARLANLMAEGLTTVEIKSGYGLDLETELRMLRVARRLGDAYPVTVRTTFLGAHALPPDYAGRSGEYIDYVAETVLPEAHRLGLVDAVDCFCERIGFSAAETDRLFTAARALGLPVKLHAEQLSDQGGAALAARHGALSADHLEWLNEDGVRAMAAAGTVAVLLPGAFYVLRETRVPPIDLLRRHGVAIALASDCNPGSSPVMSLLLILSMACTLFRLTPAEALAGVTREAARALGLQATHGTLEVGKVADFVTWDIGRPAELAYHIGLNPRRQVVRAGEIVAA
ncbi:MAG: imidazolonepropionase [Alphaproteobacteria bacterium]|nr:imidazolonepropionase [Alphaproteobacteria bacterium]